MNEVVEDSAVFHQLFRLQDIGTKIREFMCIAVEHEGNVPKHFALLYCGRCRFTTRNIFEVDGSSEFSPQCSRAGL